MIPEGVEAVFRYMDQQEKLVSGGNSITVKI
jgi:hypothetical protein